MNLVTYEVEGKIALITLRRPDRRNALNTEMSAALHAAWCRFAASDERVAFLSAEGEHFCGGVDLADASKDAWKGVPNVGVTLDKPLVCAAQGWAVGAGFTLTMMSDLCVVDETTRFLFPEARVGIFGGITAGLVSRIPYKVAMEFLMLGKPLGAERAYEVGMVNKVVAKGQQVDAGLEMARELAGLSPLVLQTIKRSALQTLPRSPAESAYPEMGRLRDLLDSEDAREGARAFAEKRSPNFTGR